MNRIQILLILPVLLSTCLFAQRSIPQFSRHVITDTLQLAKKFYVDDIDRDGDLDLAAVASNQLVDRANVIWFEDTDGDQNFSSHVISFGYLKARSITVADFDEGGHLEIAAGSADVGRTVVWTYNSGSGNWETDSSFTSLGIDNYSLRNFDLDLDGHLDLLASYADPTNALYWFEGDGSGGLTQHAITTSFSDAIDLKAGDLNGDGYPDIAAAAFTNSGNNIGWWENDGSPLNGGWTQHTIQSSYAYPNSIDVVDMDNDGDLDVLSLEYFVELDNDISWWANDGDGNFGSENVIVSNWRGGQRNVVGVDLDGDGDMDFAATSADNDIVSWFENNGSQVVTEHLVVNNFDYAYFVGSKDLDGDGDIDLIASAQNDHEISWWENDQDDDRLIANGDVDAVDFWGGNLSIDFSSGSADSVMVFFNAGSVPERSSLDNSAIHHVATNGFYTISTEKTNYSAAIDFYYGAGNIDEWSAISDESDLLICLWNETSAQWEEAGTSQTIDAVNNYISVSGLTSELKPFSKWTLGSSTSDNPLPVDLLAFRAKKYDNYVYLTWSVSAEYNNTGFEIWKGYDEAAATYLTGYRDRLSLRSTGNHSNIRHYSFQDSTTSGQQTDTYILYSVALDGQRKKLSAVSVDHYTIFSAIPDRFSVFHNYPNPFNASTNINIYLPEKDIGNPISLKIYSISGELISSSRMVYNNSGYKSIKWNGTNSTGKAVTSGTYVAVINNDGQQFFVKMNMVK